MKLHHENRIQRTAGRQVDCQVRVAEASGRDNSDSLETEIQRRAHEIYVSRKGEPGNALLDWLQAEIELRARKGKASSN